MPKERDGAIHVEYPLLAYGHANSNCTLHPEGRGLVGEEGRVEEEHGAAAPAGPLTWSLTGPLF